MKNLALIVKIFLNISDVKIHTDTHIYFKTFCGCVHQLKILRDAVVWVASISVHLHTSTARESTVSYKLELHLL